MAEEGRASGRRLANKEDGKLEKKLWYLCQVVDKHTGVLCLLFNILLFIIPQLVRRNALEVSNVKR